MYVDWVVSAIRCARGVFLSITVSLALRCSIFMKTWSSDNVTVLVKWGTLITAQILLLIRATRCRFCIKYSQQTRDFKQLLVSWWYRLVFVEWQWMNEWMVFYVTLVHIIGETGTGEPPEDGEMNEMTLPSKHRTRALQSEVEWHCWRLWRKYL